LEIKERSLFLVVLVPVLTPTAGFGTAPVPSLSSSLRVRRQLYRGISLPSLPVSKKHLSFDERNRQICLCYQAGDTLDKFACDFALSHRRVHQIIQRRG
jgi:hypothetical protein